MTNTKPAHSPIGGSKAKRWMNCTASVDLHAREGNGENSPYAQEGTLAHSLAERLLKGGTVKPGEWMDTMQGHVESYVAYVGREYKTLFANTLGGRLLVEHRAQARFHPLAFCTLDAVIISPTTSTIEVIDFKYGQSEYHRVSAVNNDQLLFGAAVLLDSLGDEASRYKTVILSIFQPRVKNGFSRVHLRKENIDWYTRQVKDTISRIEKGETIYKAGDWCYWCPKLGSCKAFTRHYKVDDMFSKDLDTLSETELQQYLDNQPLINRFFARVSAHVQNQISLLKANGQHGVYAGYTLAPTQGRMTWKDKVVMEVAIDPEEYPAAYKTELRTPKQVAEVYPALAAVVGHNSHRPVDTKLVKADTDYTTVKPFNTDDF